MGGRPGIHSDDPMPGVGCYGVVIYLYVLYSYKWDKGPFYLSVDNFGKVGIHTVSKVHLYHCLIMYRYF
jgi:hypothetical protein